MFCAFHKRHRVSNMITLLVELESEATWTITLCLHLYMLNISRASNIVNRVYCLVSIATNKSIETNGSRVND